MANIDINKEWMEWCKEHEAFPEDFIAEVMEDDDGDMGSLLEEANIYISAKEFLERTAKMMAKLKEYADFLGADFDYKRYAQFGSYLCDELFSDEIALRKKMREYKKGDKE